MQKSTGKKVKMKKYRQESQDEEKYGSLRNQRASLTVSLLRRSCCSYQVLVMKYSYKYVNLFFPKINYILKTFLKYFLDFVFTSQIGCRCCCTLKESNLPILLVTTNLNYFQNHYILQTGNLSTYFYIGS